MKRRPVSLDECRRRLGQLGETLSDAELEALVERLEDLAEWALANAPRRVRSGPPGPPSMAVDDLPRSA